MARVNIDDSLFLEPQFQYLQRKTDLHSAIGIWVVTSRLAEKYVLTGKPIPKDEIDLLDIPEAIYESKMLIEVEGGYTWYKPEQFDWLVKQRENGRKGGRPKKNKDLEKPTETQPKPKETHGLISETQNNPLTLTLTPTLTQSNTLSSKQDGKSFYFDVISKLNEITGSKIDPKGSSHYKTVVDWMKKGYSREDFYHIIEVKWQEWSEDPTMKKFTRRPKTLFGKSHFEDYLSQELVRDEKEDAFDYLDDLKGKMNG